MLCQHPGQRTDFQANDLQGRGICEQVRIGKDNGLLGLLVYVNVCLTAKFLREFCLNSGAKLLLKENLHPCIGFFVERILLNVGALFLWLVLTVSQQPSIQNQINIFEKAADQIECFGKTGAPLKVIAFFQGQRWISGLRDCSCTHSDLTGNH